MGAGVVWALVDLGGLDRLGVPWSPVGCGVSWSAEGSITISNQQLMVKPMITNLNKLL